MSKSAGDNDVPRRPDAIGGRVDYSLTLSPEERTTLMDCLQLYLTDLRRETAGTEAHVMQHALAQRQEHLEAILKRL
jgi:hypothetical protein